MNEFQQVGGKGEDPNKLGHRI